MGGTKCKNKADAEVGNALPLKAKKTDNKESKPMKGAQQVIEIVIVKANNGIDKGETKKVLENSPTTRYMLTNGYWKIK